MEDDDNTITCVYKNDVFICYAYEDREWVNHFVAQLESPQYKLKCCIHERDFETGTSTVGNIEKQLAASKKFLLVITSAFKKSKWCEYERDQILGLSIEEKERVVIPAVFEECSLPKSISHITYASVSWDFTESWFDKITMALDVKAIVCSVCSEDGILRKGYSRCPECKASYCKNCNIQHSRMPILKEHKIAKISGYFWDGDMDDIEEEWSELQNSQFKVLILAKETNTDDVGRFKKENNLLKQHDKTLKEIERRLTALEAGKVVQSHDEDIMDSPDQCKVNELPVR